MQQEKKLFFSRFAHQVSKNGTIAWYHSLRMRPVFLDKATSFFIDRLRISPSVDEIESGIENAEERQNFKDAVEALVANKVLNFDVSMDDKIIQVFRSSLPAPYIKTVFFLLTDKCNFDCTYCFIEKELAARGKIPSHMTLETAKKALDFFAGLTQLDPERFDEDKQIIFYGGEPLLNRQVLEFMLEHIKKLKQENQLSQHTRINIITNASLLEPDIVALLKENKVGVSISIDGDEDATDSARRYANNEPVYKDIRAGMDNCHKGGLPFGLSVTLSEKSLANPESTANIVYETGAISLGLNPILQTDDSYQLPADYAEKAADFILKTYPKYRDDGISEDRMMRKASAFADSRIYPFDCEASGAAQIVVSPSGEVGICHGLMNAGKYIVTDVGDKDFNPAENKVYQEWAKRSPLNMDACQDCIALGICGGGCPFVAERKTGSIWGLDEQFCVHAKKTTEWLIFDLLEQSQKNKP
jgi:uncharacterized protein